MTSNVVNLASRRIAREAVTTCPGCTSHKLCYPHRLDALAARLRDASGSSLLVPVTALDDALEVIDAITDECLPAHARTRVATPNNPTNRRAE